jgi:hypothetical protein
MRRPLVRVTWLDSASPSADWHSLSEWEGLGSLECVSVGYVIAEDDKAKTIAPHVAYPDEEANCKVCGIMIIPAGAILSIELLGVIPSARASARTSASSSRRRPS